MTLCRNKETTGDDSVLKAFVRKTQTDSVARKYSNPAMKEELMLDLIFEYLQAAQLLYDNMLEYAEQKYGKVSQMTAMTYKGKAHLYERVGYLDKAAKIGRSV